MPAPLESFEVPILQGATLDETWTLYEPGGEPTEDDPAGSPMDLTGFTGSLSIAKDYGDPALKRITTEDVAPNSRLVLGGAAGTIRVYVTDEDTDALALENFRLELTNRGRSKYMGVFDLRIENEDGEKFREAQGTIRFWPGVDRG